MERLAGRRGMEIFRDFLSMVFGSPGGARRPDLLGATPAREKFAISDKAPSPARNSWTALAPDERKTSKSECHWCAMIGPTLRGLCRLSINVPLFMFEYHAFKIGKTDWI